MQAEEAAPAPVEDVGSDEPVKPAPVEKPWIGTSISGDGWKIDFDAKVERTCIRFAATPTAAQKAIVDAAGFYYRNDLKCFVKKLTCKAYRAAQSVAARAKGYRVIASPLRSTPRNPFARRAYAPKPFAPPPHAAESEPYHVKLLHSFPPARAGYHRGL